MPTLRLLTVGIIVARAAALDNGLARTPPMGWCSWNAYGRRFNESVFYETADAMASNGMQAAGCALTPPAPLRP